MVWLKLAPDSGYMCRAYVYLSDINSVVASNTIDTRKPDLTIFITCNYVLILVDVRYRASVIRFISRYRMLTKIQSLNFKMFLRFIERIASSYQENVIQGSLAGRFIHAE